MKTFNEYVTEKNIQNESFKTLAGAAALGLGLAANTIAGAKLLGVGSFAPQSQEAPATPTTPTVAPQQQPTIQSQTQRAQEVKPGESQDQILHKNFHQGLQNKFGSEYSVILNAAKRNGIQETDHDRLAMLFAIRKTENGKHGKQFGVLHPRAYAKSGESFDQSLDRQAGWAASILGKRQDEWNSMSSADRGNYSGFHHYLQSRYAPHNVKNDPKGLNKNWLKNFTTHYNEHIGFLK